MGAISFAMMQALPGDAAFRIAAGRYGYDLMDAASAEAVRQELGLDRPLAVQLGAWLASLARLDLGVSLVSGGSIAGEIAHQLGHSLQLAFGAALVSIVVAVPVGVVAGSVLGVLASWQGGWTDRLLGSISDAVLALPGLLLVLMLAAIAPVPGGRSTSGSRSPFPGAFGVGRACRRRASRSSTRTPRPPFPIG